MFYSRLSGELMGKNNTEAGNIEQRSYQINASKLMREYFSRYLRQELEAKPNKPLATAMLINMATGSGKTYTVGTFVNDIFEYRNKYIKLTKATNVPRINILVLNDRKALVNQLKDDFMSGRADKKPLLAERFRDTITTRVFHSQAEKVAHEDEILDTDPGELMQEIEGNGNDSLTFATFQTAIKGLPIQQPNIILVDEAHHLAAETYYQSFLQFYKPDAQGQYPLVILMTATEKRILGLTGEPLVKFGLPQWIASPYSPKVNYHLVTNNKVTAEDIQWINDEIVRISQINDMKQKRQEIKILKEGEDGEGGIRALLNRYNSNDELVMDLIERIENLDKTIIFCPSIEVVDQVTELINWYTGDDTTAIAFHSKIDEIDKDILQKYTSGQSKVIIAVGKLNEGIDMPETKNVVFWRETDSETVFQQQFGRGLRGDEVSIYDYVGGMKNLAWINEINQVIDEMTEDDESEEEHQPSYSRLPNTSSALTSPKHISIIMGGVGDGEEYGQIKKIDIQDLMGKLQGLELEVELTKEMVEEKMKEKKIEEWKGMRQKEREAIRKELGRPLWQTIARMYRLKGQADANQNDWYDLLEQIFGEKIERKEKIELTKEIVEDEMKKKKIEEWKGMNIKERKTIREELGRPLWETIARMYRLKGQADGNQNDWYDLLEQVFEEEIVEKKISLTKGMVEEKMKEKEIEEWKGMNIKERKAIREEFGRPQWRTIAKMYGLKGQADSSQNDWYDLLEQVFGEKTERFTKGMVEEKMKEKEIEEWKMMSQKERKAIREELGRPQWRTIAKMYGLKGQTDGNQNDWYDLLEQVFGEEIVEKKISLTKGMVEEKIKEKEIEEWKGMNKKERKAIREEFGRPQWRTIAKMYGLKGQADANQNDRYDLLEKIFGEKIERKEKNRKK